VTGTQRKALELLAKHGSASISGSPTRVSDGRLSIHFATAKVLVRFGFVARGPDGLELTDEGSGAPA
jgi:hypothetical protein